MDTTPHRNLYSLSYLVSYFENQLPKEEIKRVDNQIEKDEEYAEWVNEIYVAWKRDPKNLIPKLDAFKDQMFSNFDSEIQKKNLAEKLLIRPVHYYVSIAASVILIGFITWQILLTSPGNTCGRDASCYLENEHLRQFDPTRLGDEDDEELDKALSLYKDANFQEAIPALEEQLEKPITNEARAEIQLCLAIANFKVGQNKEAITLLLSLEKDGDMKYQREAQWYLALMYLQNNQRGEAVPRLNALIESNSTYSSSAKKLRGESP